MAEIHTYPEMNAQIKDLLRIGEQPICLYAAKRIEELEEYERKKGEWIPVTERLPEDKVDVLVSFGENMAVAYRENDCWLVMSGGDWCTPIMFGEREPNYWMPLPEPPKEE